MEDTFSVRPSVCFEVQKITGVSIGNGNQKNYQVQWAPTWVSGFHLVGCEHLIQEFIQKQSEKGQYVDDCSETTSNRDKDDLQNNLTEDVSKKDNVTEICNRVSMVVKDDHLIEDQKHSLSSHSNITPNSNEDQKNTSSLHSNAANENVIIISMERNVLNSNNGVRNDDMYGSNEKNPNFEWVETAKDTCSKTDMYENEDINDKSTSLSFNRNDNGQDGQIFSNVQHREDRQIFSDVKHGQDEQIFSDGKHRQDGQIFSDVKHAEPLPYLNNKFINRETFGPDNIFQTKVKEEIIVIETPDSGCITKDNGNDLKSFNRPENVCNMYPNLFNNSSGHTHHSDKAYEVENMLHACGICNRIFESKATLLKHKLTHTLERQYKCDICGKAFSENSNLLSHKQTHARQLPHKCTFCEKTFLTSSKLERHSRVHTGERPFECKICKRKFTRKDVLLRHARTQNHH